MGRRDHRHLRPGRNHSRLRSASGRRRYPTRSASTSPPPIGSPPRPRSPIRRSRSHARSLTRSAAFDLSTHHSSSSAKSSARCLRPSCLSGCSDCGLLNVLWWRRQRTERVLATHVVPKRLEEECGHRQPSPSRRNDEPLSEDSVPVKKIGQVMAGGHPEWLKSPFDHIHRCETPHRQCEAWSSVLERSRRSAPSPERLGIFFKGTFSVRQPGRHPLGLLIAFDAG